jgi:putative membrane protein
MSRMRRLPLMNFLFGLMMGTADVIPGVSGGTMALIVGIYERLIASIRNGAQAVIHLVRLGPRAAWERLREIEWGLILPLGAGILTALVVGARLLVPLLDVYPVHFFALFFGLIAGSLTIPWHRMERREARHLLLAAVAAVAAFAIVGIPPSEVAQPALVFVFLAASIAICAMILPGVSGAFLLLVMGMYQPTLAALNALDVPYVAVFMLGAAVGLGVFSKLLHFLLRSHHDTTMAVLIGLMAGSLRALWPWQDADRALLVPPATGELLVGFLLAAVGFIAVLSVTRFAARRVGIHDEGPALRR